jgi:hypothetical protein
MKKMLKITLIASAVLILLVGIGAVVVLQRVDDMARHAVESAATDALGVETTLTNLDIGLLSGTCRIDGLNVANPPGYDGKSFLAMQSGEVALTYGSLRSQTVELPYLKLNGVVLNLQQQGKGGNYQVIMDNIGQGTTEENQPPPEGEKGYIIKELVISGATANVTTSILGKNITTVNLPDIKLQDVGSDTDYGAQLKDVTHLIVRAILLEITRNGFKVLPKEILAQLSGGLQKLGPIGDINVEAINKIGMEALGGAGTIAKDLSKLGKDILNKDTTTEDATKQVIQTGKKSTESAKEIVKGIGGLFGKKKKEDATKPVEQAD